MSTLTNIATILSGWKDIASHLGKGVRTVQRYEREFALPIRRPCGKSHGSVIATTAELDAWVAASPLQDSFALLRKEQPEIGTALAELTKALQEHRRLRQEMATLRAELHTVAKSLHENSVAIRLERTDDCSGVVIPSELRKQRIN